MTGGVSLKATPPAGGGVSAAAALPLDTVGLLDDPKSPVRAAAGFDGGAETPLPLDPDEEEELDPPDEPPDEPDDPDDPLELLPAEVRGMACPLATAGTASPATTAKAAK